MFRHNTFHRALLILAFVCLAAVTVYVATNYAGLEDQIPTHFNAFGVPDVYGRKSSIFVIVGVGWILYLAITILGFFPKVWNTGVKVTEANRDAVYSILGTMLCIIDCVISVFFSCMIYCSANSRGLPAPITILFLILIFGTILVSLIRLGLKK